MPSFSFVLPAPETPEAAPAFATLNGIALPISIRGGQIDPGYLEDEGRSFSGVPRRVLRAEKREWTLELVPKTQAEARAFYGLINGKGHVFNATATGLFSSTGLAPLGGHTTTVQTSGSGPHPSTSYLRVPAGTHITWPTGLGDDAPWTVLAWRKESGIWVHYVYLSTGEGWADGVWTPAGIAAEDFIDFDVGGDLTLLGDTALTDIYDVAVLPYVVPVSWGPQLYAFDVDNPRAGLPRLAAAGALFGEPLEVIGKVTTSNLVPFTGAKNGEQMSIQLREV